VAVSENDQAAVGKYFSHRKGGKGPPTPVKLVEQQTARDGHLMYRSRDLTPDGTLAARPEWSYVGGGTVFKEITKAEALEIARLRRIKRLG
jgi:hypothetical protein